MAGENLLVDRPLELVIDGIGTIQLAPGGASDAVQRAGKIEALRAELARGLDEMGVGTVEAAEQALDRRQSLAAELGAAEASLKAEAPLGVAALARSVSEAEARAQGEDGADLPARAATEALIGQLINELANTEQATRDASTSRQEIGARLAGIEAECNAKGQRAAVLAASLPPEDQAELERGRLASGVDAAAASLHEAVLAREAWVRAAPDDDGFKALSQRAKLAGDQKRARQQEHQSLRIEIAETESALRRDSEDGIEARLAELEERHGVEVLQVRALETEVAALGLIAWHLGDAEESRRETLLRPVVARLQPYLGRLFPEARIDVAGPLEIGGLVRQGRSERLEVLSEGTREQVSVLVRLAYAGMLADQGAAMPVILDDALVYSDDARLVGMFDALAAAARRHQVIVLTCHQRAFAPLLAEANARALTIEPWQVEDARAAAGRR